MSFFLIDNKMCKYPCHYW